MAQLCTVSLRVLCYAYVLVHYSLFINLLVQEISMITISLQIDFVTAVQLMVL